jgi:hypothetical protein
MQIQEISIGRGKRHVTEQCELSVNSRTVHGRDSEYVDVIDKTFDVFPAILMR